MKAPSAAGGISSLSWNDPISETLLIPLCMRAEETRRADRLFDDPFAQRVLRDLGLDLRGYEGKRMSQVGTAIRVRHFDRQVRRILATWTRPVVVHLGCGLDGRFLRTDGGLGVQLDLDLPDVMALRGRFYPPSDRNPQWSGSALETDWMDRLLQTYPGSRFAFFMEGLLMYFPEESVRTLLCRLADRFPGGELHFDYVSRWIAGHTSLHDTVRSSGVEFRWGTDDPEGLGAWHPRLVHHETAYFMSQEPRRWGWGNLFRLVPCLGRGSGALRYDILS